MEGVTCTCIYIVYVLDCAHGNCPRVGRRNKDDCMFLLMEELW